MKVAKLAFLFLLSATLGQAQQTGGDALERVITAAMQNPEWASAVTQSDRLAVLRESALVYESESDPVSDRYFITALAGPVDFVHFFFMARYVCDGKDRRTTLYREWRREGGESYDPRRRDNPAADATPDDLPSNALGALFGEEQRRYDKDLVHDLLGDLRRFFAALEPVPDSVVKTLSHDRIVLGLSGVSTSEERVAKHQWFTAMPAYILPIVAPERVASIPDSAAALNKAGLELRTTSGIAIILDRIGTPDPEPPKKKFTRAVPVGQKPSVSKAVPVK